MWSVEEGAAVETPETQQEPADAEFWQIDQISGISSITQGSV